jgi:hypothetical protein
MKKITTIILTLFLIGLFIGLCYLIYKTWNIFGFWTLTWTGLASIISTLFLGQLIGSRSEKNGAIIYNPKEWPKFLNMIFSLVIGYYLFTIISLPNISSYDYTFGMAYLILFTGIPISICIFKLIRDRNDFISIDETFLKYKDNNETGEIKFKDIKGVELSGGIKLTFIDDTTLTIKTANMSFNAKDLSNVFCEIKAKLPQ